jgi:hypothetical protein
MAREEKNKLFSKKNIVSMFIVFIMVSSVVGYMWGKDIGEKFKHNDYKFVREKGGWTLKVEDTKLFFNYFPTEVEDIDIGSDIINRVNGVIEIDSTSSENDSFVEAIAQAQFSMQQELNKVSNVYIRVGMLEENEYDFPVITCADATVMIPVLYFRKSNETKVELDENCIIAEAKNNYDVIRIKDRLLYGMLGIIEP